MFPTINDIPATTKVIVFDLDGTLYNKHLLITRMPFYRPHEAFMMLAERRARKALKGVWKGNEEALYHAFFTQLAKGHCYSAAYAQRWFNEKYVPLIIRLLRKFYPVQPWVMPFINDCRSKGLSVILLTDYQGSNKKLEAIGLSADIFDWVVSAPELGGLKPAPELMYKVAERMQVTPQECMVIGDREDTDGDMARATGAAFFKVEY